MRQIRSNWGSAGLTITMSAPSTPTPRRRFEPTSKRRRGYPSQARVKRGPRSIKGGEVELLERLGNDAPCPWGSGRRFQELPP
jgi:hypothetical protein